MQALLLCGGMGKRLGAISSTLPKPMVPIAGRPVLEHAVMRLKNAGIDDVRFFTGVGADAIEHYFGNGARFGMRFTYYREDSPLGTAGGVVRALPELDDDFLVIYGDTIFNIDLQRMTEFHARTDADATLFLHPNDHPFDSDLVKIDGEGRITAFHPCPHSGHAYLRNLVSAALYILKKDMLAPWMSHDTPLDFARDIFPALIRNRRTYGYVSREYIKDMGTPERLARVEADVASGKVERGSLATPRPAIFLDRDGTLAHQVDYVRRPEEMVLEQGAADAVREINRSEYLAVLITNQPVVARGDVTEEELREIHNTMEQELGKSHAYLDAIYYCPHHPDRGFPGERLEYKIACDCRKPGIKLIQDAAKELNIDLSRSWFVGDSTVDIQTARNAGVRSILVKTGYGGSDKKYAVSADAECANLPDAVRGILG